MKLVLALADADADTARHAGHVVGVQLTHPPLTGTEPFQLDAAWCGAAEHQRVCSSPQFAALHRQTPDSRQLTHVTPDLGRISVH